MVKKMIVLMSAMALVLGAVGAASAFLPGMAMGGDMIMIPMKVKTAYIVKTGPSGYSTLFMDGCDQYSAGFTPWGPWAATKCSMKVQVIPPKCVAPAMSGPMQWGAPPAVAPGCKLISNIEKYSVKSPGCNPCVDGGMMYEMVKKQVVK